MSSLPSDSPPPPGPHGGDALAIARWLGVGPDDVIDLSASLNPEAPDVAAIVRERATSIGRYPDASRATAALAEAIGVDAGRVVLTNGGAEAIALVAGLEPVGSVEQPEFSLYERHLARVEVGAPRWRSNPGNPRGLLADPADTARVWDEAFWQLAAGTWTRGDDTAWRVGSLTKLWACPGLRIGYAIAPDERLADALRTRQPRWAVNSLGVATIEELVPRTDLTAWSAAIARRRNDLLSLVRRHGLVASETDACWILVEAVGLREVLLPHGVVVRDCTSFGMPTTSRVAVPDNRGFDRLAFALDEVFG